MTVIEKVKNHGFEIIDASSGRVVDHKKPVKVEAASNKACVVVYLEEGSNPLVYGFTEVTEMIEKVSSGG